MYKESKLKKRKHAKLNGMKKRLILDKVEMTNPHEEVGLKLHAMNSKFKNSVRKSVTEVLRPPFPQRI